MSDLMSSSINYTLKRSKKAGLKPGLREMVSIPVETESGVEVIKPEAKPEKPKRTKKAGPKVEKLKSMEKAGPKADEEEETIVVLKKSELATDKEKRIKEEMGQMEATNE
jgi:hypothetical protein